MLIAPGTKHGVYVIGELLGKGGMGEVYQARDTKLDRVVAIKFLPESVARDRELLARFEREAKTLASLNHVNIAHVYGLEEANGVLAIVMEHVAGRTLHEYIRQGPVRVKEAIGIARQIASALEAAHESGVIHRDLKPANVKITPEGVVKLLDFGLAKSFANPASVPDDSATLSMRRTETGVMLGTAGYMAPEQVLGEQVDKRADVWAYGAVLYELLTGKRAFPGANMADIMAATLRADPDWAAIPRETPEAVVRLLERCLERDRSRRLRDIGDAWRMLPEAMKARERVLRSNTWLWAGLAAVLIMALAVLLRWPAQRQNSPLRRLTVILDDAASLAIWSGPATILTSDGTRVAFVSVGKDESRRLYTRRLDQAEARALAGTEGASNPFFSPDGQWIGFFVANKLKKVSVEGGAAITLCELATSRPGSGSWGVSGEIIASLGGGLVRVPESGGTPEPVTKLGPGENQHSWPSLLPGGKAALFLSNTTPYADSGTVEAVVLATGERKVLRRNAYFGRYAADGGRGGHLLWISQGTLFAAPMDAGRLELTGPAIPVVERVFVNDVTGSAQVDIVDEGTLVYVEQKAPLLSTIQWVDAAGTLQPIISKPAEYSYPVLSPDGKQLAFLQQVGGNRDIWVHDLAREVPRRLTFTEGENEYVYVWTPDGKSIIYSEGKRMRMVSAGGGGEPVTIYEEKDSNVFIHAISADGRYLAYCVQGVKTGNDLWTVALEGTSEQPKVGKPQPFQATQFYEIHAGFSPDGKWLAFGSNESGVAEVYARPFPGGNSKHQISIGGGMRPVWSPNGRELFYNTADGRMMIVDYKSSGGSITFSKPRQWSQRKFSDGSHLRNFSLTPDGKRFAIVLLDERQVSQQNNEVIFLENLPAELRRRAGK